MPPINNASERALCDYAIQRQAVVLHALPRGMDFIERIFSTVQNDKMRGRMACDFITDAMQSWCGKWRPPGLVQKASTSITATPEAEAEAERAVDCSAVW